MSSRRTFLRQVAAGTAWAAAAGVAPARVLGANDRIRFGWIGAGARGTEIFQAALKCPNVEAVAVADVYTRRLDEAKAIVPGMKTYNDFRRLLDDKSIDAVLISTPQHQHALNFVPAIEAGKDVYQEKTMAFNPDHARRMRKAFVGSGRVVQVGMQMNGGAGLPQVKELVAAKRLGKITAIEAHHFRNGGCGGWARKIPADCDQQHVDWLAFEGEAKKYPFDAQRYINWRLFWDYSGGNFFENMVHAVGFWQAALALSIPESVTTVAANYSSPTTEMPDMMMVCMKQAENLLFTWNSNFNNAYFGEGHDYLFGTRGTVLHNEADQVFFLPQGKREDEAGRTAAARRTGYFDYTQKHMQNFFDCVRSRKDPLCTFEVGYRAAIACQMAVASHRQQRTVRWDPKAEDIV